MDNTGFSFPPLLSGESATIGSHQANLIRLSTIEIAGFKVLAVCC